MLPKDYVRLRLCGEHAIDMADASGTLLLDVARRRWSEEVLDALELDPAWLPRLLESPEVSGETPAGVPVAAGAGDQAAGALGVGVDRPGPLSIALGTSGVVFAALPAFAADARARVHAFCHAVPGGWHAMGVMLSAAGSLQWLRDVAAPGTGFGELVEEAAAWEPGVEGLTFLPYLAGERTPHADPDARGSFTGLSLRHDRGALTRAVLEGVAYGLRDSLDLVRELGVTPERGRVSGGGARSELWLRIVASVLELPLERPVVEEGAAYGAALLGGVAGGVFPDTAAAVAATLQVRGEVEPEPDWVPLRRGAGALPRALPGAARGALTRQRPAGSVTAASSAPSCRSWRSIAALARPAAAARRSRLAAASTRCRWASAPSAAVRRAASPAATGSSCARGAGIGLREAPGGGAAREPATARGEAAALQLAAPVQ